MCISAYAWFMSGMGYSWACIWVYIGCYIVWLCMRGAGDMQGVACGVMPGVMYGLCMGLYRGYAWAVCLGVYRGG